MSDWKPRVLVVQAILRLPDGTEKQTDFHLRVDALGMPDAVFADAQMFPVHGKPMTHDGRIETTEGPVPYSRGHVLTYDGEPVHAKMEPPEPGAPLVRERLEVQTSYVKQALEKHQH